MASVGLHKRRAMPRPTRKCYCCHGPIPDDEKAIKAKNAEEWMHFECWYDGRPFKRDPKTGRRCDGRT